MKQTRIYIVRQDSKVVALIRATSAPQALAHYTSRHTTVSLAGQDDLILATKAGIEPVDARDGDKADATTLMDQQAQQAQVRG